jgi:hypothetical protein
MSEKEKIESCIATCKCCLLAQAMRECPLCRFNIGLAERIDPSLPQPIFIPIGNIRQEIKELAMAE